MTTAKDSPTATAPAPINIGIDEPTRRQTAEGLCRVLANTYTLYLKTHNFHWNVTGPQFQTLHLMFEEQYQELATAVDSIAERIRTLGHPAPGTYHEFDRLSAVRETTGIPDPSDMVRQLVEDHETVVRVARDLFQTADDAGDESTADLLTHRMKVHEKTAWMLRSLLD